MMCSSFLCAADLREEDLSRLGDSPTSPWSVVRSSVRVRRPTRERINGRLSSEQVLTARIEPVQSSGRRHEQHELIAAALRTILPESELSSASTSCLCQTAVDVEMVAGATVFNAGDAATRFFVVESGEVRLSTGSRDASDGMHRTATVELVTAGDHFGDAALVGGSVVYDTHAECTAAGRVWSLETLSIRRVIAESSLANESRASLHRRGSAAASWFATLASLMSPPKPPPPPSAPDADEADAASPSSGDSPSPPPRLAELVCEGPLGTGGFSTVWRVRIDATDERFALKVLHKAEVREQVEGPLMVERERQVLALCRRQPASLICRSVAFLQCQHHLYMLLELLPGGRYAISCDLAQRPSERMRSRAELAHISTVNEPMSLAQPRLLLPSRPRSRPRSGQISSDRSLSSLLSSSAFGGAFDRPTQRFCTACACVALGFLHEHRIACRDLKPENLMVDSRGYVRLHISSSQPLVTNAMAVATKPWRALS